MAIDDMSDGDGPTSPRSSDDVVRPPKVRPNLFDLLQQIESSDDDVSRRVALFFWEAHLIDQTYPRRHSANPPKEIHRVETLSSLA